MQLPSHHPHIHRCRKDQLREILAICTSHDGSVIATQTLIFPFGTSITGRSLARLSVHLTHLVSSLLAFVATIASIARRTGLAIRCHLFRVILVRLCHPRRCKSVCCALVFLIHCPHHKAIEASGARKFSLLLEGIVVVIRDPLITVPGDPWTCQLV